MRTMVPLALPAMTPPCGWLDCWFGITGSLDFVLAAIVLPLQRLQVHQIVSATVRDWDDVIDLPAITAPCVAKILPNDSPTPRIHPQGLVDSHTAGLAPHRLDHFFSEGPAIRVRVGLSFH